MIPHFELALGMMYLSHFDARPAIIPRELISPTLVVGIKDNNLLDLDKFLQRFPEVKVLNRLPETIEMEEIYHTHNVLQPAIVIWEEQNA